MSRLALFGGMASGVLGGMLVDGALQVARGRRPSASDLLLTPGNALRVTHQLAHLRGAAMKAGQLISMDAGEVLPAELTGILSRLREDAHPMPAAQLNATLKQQWGADWRSRFAQFSATPLAAASIGQVHRARTLDGRELAIKIQYPGVRESIDSDVDNVGTLLRLSGLLPKGLDIAPLLAAAKQQLHEEADYGREGECLLKFRQLLEGSPEFLVPDLAADFSTEHVLAMTYVQGVPIESSRITLPRTQGSSRCHL
jgi:predicted unusual protein kinase regulating ubiquinone biosynthesis (AarF/ABC1/UbiB family)